MGRGKPQGRVARNKAKAPAKVMAAKKRKFALGGNSTTITCPVFVVSQKEFPGHAALLKKAQKQGISLKGLKRLTGKNNIRRNRRRSQAPIRKLQGGPPAGFDYDEFPYASTQQGGHGAVILVNQSEDNQGAGRALGQFYRKNNIEEGDTYDVEIGK